MLASIAVYIGLRWNSIALLRLLLPMSSRHNKQRENPTILLHLVSTSIEHGLRSLLVVARAL